MLKKLLTSILLSLTLLFSMAPILTAKAQSTWYNQGFFDWYDKVYNTNTSPSDQIFGERYTAAQVQWVIYSLISLPINFIGNDGQKIVACFIGVLGNSGDITPCATNTITFVNNIINTLRTATGTGYSGQSSLAAVFNAKDRPLSGIGYVERLVSKFSIVSSVNAQTTPGFGYTALQALQKYWTGFRNIAYAIIVLVTIIFAFLIMFRVKLNPQTVISVQSALPKIIVAIILATFSYAIAGFLVDLTYVVSGLFASLLQTAGFTTPIFGSSTVDIYNWIVPSAFSSALGNFVIFGYMLLYTVVFLFGIVWSVVGTLSGLSVYGFFASILALLLVAWLLILMLWYTIKVPWVLIKNLISIYLSIVVAPVQIVAGTLVPSLSFGNWFKKLIAELMVFPVTGLLMYLAWLTLINSFVVNYYTIGQNVKDIFGGSVAQPEKLWAPPIIGSVGDMSGLLWLAISFAIIALLPKVVDMMKGLIMGEKFSLGTAIGEATGPLKTGYSYMGGAVLQKGAGYAGASFTTKQLENLAGNTRLPEIITKPAGSLAKNLRKSMESH